MSSIQADATTVAMIVGAETGEIIKIGDLPEDFYPKLARAMVQMQAELNEFRKRPGDFEMEQMFKNPKASDDDFYD